MGGHKKKLAEIGKTKGKGRDLLPASDAVKSAIAYMKEIENFFSEKSHGQIPIYPLLWHNLQGKQLDGQPAMISGRLFHETNCFIRQDLEKGIDQRELKDVAAREKKPNGEKKYNFVSESIVKKMDALIKNRDPSQIDEILNSVVHDIENNPAWIHFWQERIGLEGVDVELQTKVLQSLVYKMMGDCYQSYLAKNDVPVEAQRTARNFVNALNEAAKTVTPLAPITEAKRTTTSVPSFATPDVPSIEPAIQPQNEEGPRQRRAPAYLALPARTTSLTSSSQPSIRSQSPSVPETKPTRIGRVKQMAQEYERKIEEQNAKPTSPKKR
ncbi:hypothetical protein [Candidatus Berkiella aquae]|uniref:Uncharacterized protein n=1 Tax=Candidatus Berkiella aquae TaxID=295108 RepID=A0A0Q9YJG3_9GAMM|nr:hypothetical protein [Candidatus Berkiella aquae]MCS5711273.1 hypothetical protein [Candidatus Berkiella aquae]